MCPGVQLRPGRGLTEAAQWSAEVNRLGITIDGGLPERPATPDRAPARPDAPKRCPSATRSHARGCVRQPCRWQANVPPGRLEQLTHSCSSATASADAASRPWQLPARPCTARARAASLFGVTSPTSAATIGSADIHEVLIVPSPQEAEPPQNTRRPQGCRHLTSRGIGIVTDDPFISLGRLGVLRAYPRGSRKERAGCRCEITAALECAHSPDTSGPQRDHPPGVNASVPLARAVGPAAETKLPF